jgi:heme exporter protein B
LGEDIMQQAHIWAFLSVLALGISGMTIAFNFVASIGAQQASASSFSAILGLPIVLPLLSATVQSAKLAIQGFDWLVINPSIINMLALSSLSLGLSLVLFPYIWQE